MMGVPGEKGQGVIPRITRDIFARLDAMRERKINGIVEAT